MKLWVAVLLAGSALAQKPHTVKVSGHVTDGFGAAIPRATIRATAPGRREMQGRTNQKGIFKLAVGRSVKYQLQISAAGFKPLQREFEAARDTDLGEAALPAGEASIVDTETPLVLKPKH
jgi:hypothetical protein